jgi:pimeloyl-ACP methyl ester carboxylesterase
MPHLEGVRHSFVDAGGLRVHVAEAGPEDADAVVLIHGWPQHWWEWRQLMPALAGERRVIAPDLRGLGWTDAPARDYRKETLALDLVRTLDALGVERADLVGHDWGGWVAYLAALFHTERVRSVLALNILPPMLPRTPRAVLGQWRLWYQWVLGSPFGARVARNLSKRGSRIAERMGVSVWSDAEREAFFGQLADPARARATVRYYRDFQLRELPRIAMGRYEGMRLEPPTRILFGTLDRVQDHRLLEGVEALGDDLSCELVPGVGHFIVDERPELVIERARELLG